MFTTGTRVTYRDGSSPIGTVVTSGTDASTVLFDGTDAPRLTGNGNLTVACTLAIFGRPLSAMATGDADAFRHSLPDAVERCGCDDCTTFPQRMSARVSARRQASRALADTESWY